MSPRVLVVEDDEDVATLLVAAIEHAGWSATIAGDGLRGLLQVATAPPDAVILDVMMPDVDGVRVLQQWLDEHHGRLPFPVLVVTGSPDGAARCRDLLGPEAVIEKPFDPDDVIARLKLRL